MTYEINDLRSLYPPWIWWWPTNHRVGLRIQLSDWSASNKFAGCGGSWKLIGCLTSLVIYARTFSCKNLRKIPNFSCDLWDQNILLNFHACQPIKELDSESGFLIGQPALNLWRKFEADWLLDKLSNMQGF